MKNILCINKPLSCLGLLLLISFLLPTASVKAQGNVLINPKRVIFNGKNRSQEIHLANIGKDTARYVLSFIQIRMKDDGSFEEITQPDPGQNFADKYLRIFPRSVVLPPNEAQLVKIQLNQASNLLPGEYRSHLYFRAVPNEKPLGEKAEKPDSGLVAIQLTPVFGISIPILIRQGTSDTKVSLSNLEIEGLTTGQPLLKATFNRSGNMSAYGDLTIEHISKEGKVTKAGLIKGISVYTPNTSRDIKIKLDTQAGVNYRSGKLRVIYTAPVEEKGEKLAVAELMLK